MRWRHALGAGVLIGALGCDSSTTNEAGNRDSAGAPTAMPGSGAAGIGSMAPGGQAPGSGARAGSGGSGGTAVPTLPPEVEVEREFEQPQASERFVYAANPESGTVSIIDAQTLAIQTLETGDRPTFLRTLANSNDAIVLNVGSQDATIIRSPERGIRTITAPVVRGANAIAVAPDGKHAVVYFNARFSAAGNPSGSFQDVTVLRLDGEIDDDDISVGMTVGFRPRDVFFAADSSEAYVVTDDGISVLDFEMIETSGSGIARLVSLGPDVDQQGFDVSVTPDGLFALTRAPGQSVVRLVDLGDGSIRSLDLAAVLPGSDALDDVDGDSDGGTAEPVPVDVTDLDLAPSGAFALAVLRGASVVLEIPIPGGFDAASAIETHEVPGELIGSVTITPQADRALLYTTAVDVERITVLTLDGDAPPKTVALRKTVEAVTVAPDGRTALILHKKVAGDPLEPGITPDQSIDRSFGYSVLRVATGDVKLQVTPTPPGVFTIVPDGSYLFILFNSAGVREVEKIEAKSFLIDEITLGSPPISLGSVPQSERVFVNQQHPDGRITFIDWQTGEARTVTGFELNSRIQD
jgi:hypothetical protein